MNNDDSCSSCCEQLAQRQMIQRLLNGLRGVDSQFEDSFTPGNDNSGFGETVLLTGIFLLWVLLMSMWFLFARNRQNDRGIEKHNSNGGDTQDDDSTGPEALS